MIIANFMALIITIGISYTLIAGFDPALDDLASTVFTTYPTMGGLESAFIRVLPIIIFFIPMFFLVRKAIKKVFKQG